MFKLTVILFRNHITDPIDLAMVPIRDVAGAYVHSKAVCRVCEV